MVQALTEKLEHTRLVEKERVAQCHKESSWQVRQSYLYQKEKEQSRQSKVPDCKGERVKGSKSHTLVRERDIRAGAYRGKKERVNFTMKEGRFQAGEGGQARKATREK